MKKISSFCVMKDLIGKILEELLQKEGAPSKEDFSGMLGISVKTLYNVTKSKSYLDFDQVVTASKILNFNIPEEYYRRVGKNEINFLSENTAPSVNHGEISVTLTLTASISSYINFPDLLVKVSKEANEVGFKII